MCDGVVLVTDAVPLDGHRVAVRFSDSYSGVLDMAKYFGYPAFAGLNDPAVFATARAGCVCSIESGPCERVESLQMSGRF